MKPSKAPLTFRLPDELEKPFAAKMKSTGWSKSKLILEALEAFLDKSVVRKNKEDAVKIAGVRERVKQMMRKPTRAAGHALGCTCTLCKITRGEI